VPAAVQISTIRLQSTLKNPNQSDPQGFANVMCETGSLQRTDGGRGCRGPDVRVRNPDPVGGRRR
jgi:hypothetical protein